MTDIQEKEGDAATPPKGRELAHVDDTVVEAFREHVASLAVADDVDVQEKVLRAVLAATTAEDILRAGEAVPAVELNGVPITVLGIRASESGFVDGADYYLHVDATVLANGDPVTFSCGASDVAMKLIRLDQLNLFPVDCVLTLATKATKAGYFPMFLRMLDADQRPF